MKMCSSVSANTAWKRNRSESNQGQAVHKNALSPLTCDTYHLKTFLQIKFGHYSKPVDMTTVINHVFRKARRTIPMWKIYTSTHCDYYIVDLMTVTTWELNIIKVFQYYSCFS